MDDNEMMKDTRISHRYEPQYFTSFQLAVVTMTTPRFDT